MENRSRQNLASVWGKLTKEHKEIIANCVNRYAKRGRTTDIELMFVDRNVAIAALNERVAYFETAIINLRNERSQAARAVYQHSASQTRRLIALLRRTA